MHTLVTCASERTFAQGQTDSQRRREASSKEIRSRARERKKRSANRKCDVRGMQERRTAILSRLPPDPDRSILSPSSPSSPSQSCTPHPHINSFSSGSCYRASLLFSHSLPPPAFCVIWWLLHLLVLACFSSRAVSLKLNFWSHLHHAHLESAPTQEENLLRIVTRVSENKILLL